ncbi:MAG: flagellin [Lachnospiraceae bacterium]|nr:flagellin [Lachnospiraceae bacterium]
MVVQHNMQAMNTNRQLGLVTGQQAKSTEKLSSGYKINRAADDAAGLAISEKMRSQIRGLDRASTNAQDGISVVQTAEGALNEVHSMLQRMNELATQAANDTNTTQDRNQIKLEINQLSSEIDRVASTTQFNTMNLLDGKFVNKNLQVGALSGQSISISISSMKSSKLGLGVTGSALSVSSFAAAGSTMKKVQSAIDMVSTQRAKLGAIQNRLEHTIANLDTTSENTSAAESRIRDTDMAKEMVNYSKNNILAQAGQSMLAQANQSTQGVLSLLG